MSTVKRLIFVEVKEDEIIEELLKNSGVKILENELIKGGTINKVENFFGDELRQEYLQNYEWFQRAEQEKNPLYLKITEETYKKVE